MTIVNKVKLRGSPASWRTTRELYENGVKTNTANTDKNYGSGFPRSDIPGYVGNYKSYYNSSDWRTVLESQGWLGTKALQHRRTKIGGSLFNNTYRKPSNPNLNKVVISSGYLNVPSNVDVIESGSVRAAAVQPVEADATDRCLSKARDMRVNVPVFFAEGKKSVDLLYGSAQTLAKAYGAFRKGRFKQAAKALGIKKPTRTAAGHWLAYQYGWKPIVSDAVGAATMLYDWLERREERTMVLKSSGKIPSFSFKKLSPEWLYLGPHPQLVGWIMIYTAERTIKSRAGLRLTPSWSVARAQSQLGMTPSDILNTAWELTPFSFVFDWFVDIGGWLEQQSALQGFSVLDGFITTETTYKGLALEWPYGSMYSQPDSQILWPYETVETNRRFWNGMPTYLRYPLWDGLNANRVTTLGALCVQLFKLDRKPGGYKP